MATWVARPLTRPRTGGLAQAAALSQQVNTVTRGKVLDPAADLSGETREDMRRVLADLDSGVWLEANADDPTLGRYRGERPSLAALPIVGHIYSSICLLIAYFLVHGRVNLKAVVR